MDFDLDFQQLCIHTKHEFAAIVDSEGKVDAVFFYIAKALDKVTHHKSLYKLE